MGHKVIQETINVVTGLDNIFSGTDCVFSPDEQVVMTGVSVRKGEVKRPPVCQYSHTYIFLLLQGKRKLLFFNRELEQVYQLAVSDAVGSLNKC